MTKSEYNEFIAKRDRDYMASDSSKYDIVSNPYLPSEMVLELCRGNVMPCLFGGKTKTAQPKVSASSRKPEPVHHKIGTKIH